MVRGCVLVEMLLLVLPASAGAMEPCKPGSRAWVGARESLANLEAALAKMQTAQDARQFAETLETLLRTRCFPRDWDGDPLADGSRVTPAAVRAWWRDGGHRWLKSYLTGGTESGLVVFPPELRTTFSPDRGSALSLLACQDDCADASWTAEAAAAMAAAAKADPFAERQRDPHACARIAPSDGYFVWRSCVDEARPRAPALPVGRFRFPSEGWLVVRGRRGHYEFCDEVRAFSLTTGAAYVSSSCSGLVLHEDGLVDAGATDARRGEAIRAGRLPLDRLRSVALLLFLSEFVEDEVAAAAFELQLPRNVKMSWLSAAKGEGAIRGGHFWGSSAQTQLGWVWATGAGSTAEGELTWPNSMHPAETVVAERLQALEGQLVPGCPEEPLPVALLDFTRSPGVNHLDAPDGVEATDWRLEAALMRWTCSGADGGAAP